MQFFYQYDNLALARNVPLYSNIEQGLWKIFFIYIFVSYGLFQKDLEFEEYISILIFSKKGSILSTIYNYENSINIKFDVMISYLCT